MQVRKYPLCVNYQVALSEMRRDRSRPQRDEPRSESPSARCAEIGVAISEMSRDRSAAAALQRRLGHLLRTDEGGNQMHS